MNRIVLIGLGPHAKRIYISTLKKIGYLPVLIVDLASQREKVEKFLSENNIKCNTIFFEDKYANCEELPDQSKKELLKWINVLKINQAIISTEPKSHYAYMKFFIENHIGVLVDKPIIALENMNTVESIDKMKKQYNTIIKLKQENNVQCKVLCQRKYHEGYKYIKRILKDTIEQYNIPITYISIYHCDGNWMLPHDFDRENHPYKYGYGKLFHSGFHFIDLLVDFLKLNLTLKDTKLIRKANIDCKKYGIDDSLNNIQLDDISHILKTKICKEDYCNFINKDYTNYGELDFYSLMQFKNENNRVITTANLNLLQNGFSRRAWFDTPENMYKGNGRIRHESINIQVGPLLNIQVHSYQSKEIKDRLENSIETLPGGLEHFDIYIFRNADLIGGKPFEKVSIRDLYNNLDTDFKGYNEKAREDFIKDFILGVNETGNIEEYKLAMEILYQSCIALQKGNQEFLIK